MTINDKIELIRKNFSSSLDKYGYKVVDVGDNIYYNFYEIDWQTSLDFENCSDNFISRWLCYLAHGEDSCGSKKYCEIKKIAKKAYKEIQREIYEDVSLTAFLVSIKKRPHFSFEINREMVRIIVSLWNI